MAQVLWDLVNSRNLNPVGAFTQGMEQRQQMDARNARRSVLAELAQDPNIDLNQAAMRLLPHDPQTGATLAQLGMRQDDQRFRRETRGEDVAWRQQQAEEARRRFEATHGLQQQIANRPQVVTVTNEFGQEVPVLVDRSSGTISMPGGIGGQPGAGQPGMQQPQPAQGGPPPVGQFSGSVTDAFRGQSQPQQQPVQAQMQAQAPQAGGIPPPPPGVNPRKWIEEQTKLLAKETGPENQRELRSATESQASIAGYTLRDARIVREAIDGMVENPLLRLGRARIPGTDEYRAAQFMDSLRGTIAIEQLLNIKRQGSGLGQVPQAQLDMLSFLMGKLDMGLPKEDLKMIVGDIQDRYKEIIGAMSPRDRQMVGIADREFKSLMEGGSGGGQGGTAGAPQVGTVEDGYRFKGGDPANPNDWERVN